jgi:hypothetical protein
MHGHLLDQPLQKWFDFPVPKTSVAPDHIQKALQDQDLPSLKDSDRFLWIGKPPLCTIRERSKKGHHWEEAVLEFRTLTGDVEWRLDKAKGQWLAGLLTRLTDQPDATITGQEIRNAYEEAGFDDLELFWDNKPVNTIARVGFLRI